MSLTGDARILWSLAFRRGRGDDHAARLESFYRGQARDYDDFRRRLLPGRDELFAALPAPAGGVWIDFGGGTGANLERLGPRLADLRRVYVVDLCPSLLAIARERARRAGWDNVECVEADATRFVAPAGPADVVTCSYSLTMMPDWWAAIEQARRLLRPGGLVGVVDFYVARKHPASGRARHSAPTRAFWPAWFGLDGVFPSPDHLPYLQDRFETVELAEGRARLPWLPLARAPWYRFIGRRQG